MHKYIVPHTNDKMVADIATRTLYESNQPIEQQEYYNMSNYWNENCSKVTFEHYRTYSDGWYAFSYAMLAFTWK